MELDSDWSYTRGFLNIVRAEDLSVGLGSAESANRMCICRGSLPPLEEKPDKKEENSLYGS